uniref:Transcription factor GTE10 isoform X3 n=1 Tax=Nicotiana tabacum TaxID=4097 RepID=A0A1S4CJN6_TOBAC|nr:PREDICTED: transcription factor GTE10-like isoform X3 [Nicotiana tabacum]
MVLTVPVHFTGQGELNKCFNKGSGEMMGKSRKVSRGYVSGFVPDYCHAVGTMAESEGFGSSGRVETEMTASDDSCAPKKRCINLSADDYDQFSVPTQVLSLSKMSCSERKDLKIRLRTELEHVRILQKKIASFSSNFGVLSPVSDIHSCSDGWRRPGAEISQSFMKEAKVPRGKKKTAQGRNGPRTKGLGARRPEPVKQAVSNTSIVMFMKQCETLLNRMMSHQYGWVFNAPVDVVKLKIPDYFTVIKHPMDLGTVQSKLMSGEYLTPLEFSADVRLTFKNAMTYNSPGNDVHIMAQTLSKFFEVRWKQIEKNIPVAEEEPLPSKSSVILETESEAPLVVPPYKKKKIAPFENKGRSEPVKQVMSDFEKHKLSMELEALLAELPEKIIDFLKESSLHGSQVSEDEIEIDIDALTNDTLYKLRQLLDEYLLDKQKSQAKAEPCEMENESGFSNSSMQPCKDNDPADEEVDIGGNDPPVSSFTPVEIEKDLVRRANKCSSSSSSRSDLGSSSSDSGSSSSGESDGAKGSIPLTNPKQVTASSGLSLEQKELDQRESRDSLDGFTERNSQPKSILGEPNDHHEGESAPPERQVSPEKLYRAALLRSRFADTILKAQEKTLEKGEVWDPEKLKLGKEELERRRREEKARLQAEAKAAGEARREAEAEAAAEAKKKRELEREAARQALLKMEKTVEINENSQFMEDLELFRAAPDEQLERFTEETSPGHSQNGLGSFKFKASSNPLEQLGLYMKGDGEDEEENESHSIPDLSNCPEDISKDPEEGEID